MRIPTDFKQKICNTIHAQLQQAWDKAREPDIERDVRPYVERFLRDKNDALARLDVELQKIQVTAHPSSRA